MSSLIRYLTTCVLLIMVGFSIFFHDALKERKAAVLQENVAGRRLLLDLVADSAEERVRLGLGWEEALLIHDVSTIDQAKGTYAELFDFRLNSLSPRSPSFVGNPFRIENHPGAVSQIMMQDRGDTIVPFAKDANSKPHDLHLYWRWIPSSDGLDRKYVIIIGVSEYSLESGTDDKVSSGVVALLVFGWVLAIAYSVLGNIMGHWWFVRKGDKYRAKL